MWAYPWSSSLTHSDFSMQRRETSRLHQEARLSATEWRGVPSLTGISGSARRSAQSGGDQSHPPNRASESVGRCVGGQLDREALLEQRTRTSQRSEEHTSELQSLMRISYAVFCLKKKNKHKRAMNTSNL